MKIEVSESTRQFLDCLNALDEVYDKVSDAISSMYSGSQADSIITQYYHAKHVEVKNAIREFLCISIEGNLHDGNNII